MAAQDLRDHRDNLEPSVRLVLEEHLDLVDLMDNLVLQVGDCFTIDRIVQYSAKYCGLVLSWHFKQKVPNGMV